MTLENLSDKKSIRSFVLRNHKLSDNKKNLFNKLMPVWGIPYNNQRIDLCKVFSNNAPKILDIGFGVGNSTLEIAKTFPNYDFIAVDVYMLGVINLLKLINSNNIQNIKIIHHDVVDVVNNMLANNSLYGIHIFFPDPWPKKKHHKRRLIQEDFIKKLSNLLIVDGYIHIATDYEKYAVDILEILTNNKNLINSFVKFAFKPYYRNNTKFELKAKEKGHKIFDLIFRKINNDL